MLYLRISSRSQKGNLLHQKTKLLNELEREGFKVIAIFEETAPGWMDQRTAFWRAVETAKAAGAAVVAESVDRFRRCYRYRSYDPQPPLSLFELERLKAEANGVKLATLIHPDNPTHGEQIKRGQQGKRRYGGRPKIQCPKKSKRLESLATALKLRKRGLSYREIGRNIDVPFSTVRDWLQR